MVRSARAVWPARSAATVTLLLVLATPGPVLPAAEKPAAVAKARVDFAQRDDVRAFVRDLVARHGFEESELTALLSRARPNETVLRLMAPPLPGTKRSWSAYRARFVEPVRIREGLRFWRSHASILERAARQWGVPEEIIVSVIGVETLYGRHTGTFRVIDSLAALAFEDPRRAAYFRDELEQYLLLAREAGFDPLTWRGSFAGAVGLPQFMPGSIRRHAVDFDGDGRIDLQGSPADAIGSVARFLANHGWTPGTDTHYPVAVEDEVRVRLIIETGIPPRLHAPRLLASSLGDQGLSSPAQPPQSEPLSLIDLPDGDDPLVYALVTDNFFVITRYNRSYFYAMAVAELARALRRGLASSAPARAGAD